MRRAELTTWKAGALAVGASAMLAVAYPEAVISQGTDRRSVASEPHNDTSRGKLRLMPGDRLKLTFFEMIDTPKGGAAGPGSEPGLRSFYQRVDFTGEYPVDPDGTLVLPRLGPFSVAGRSVQALQRDLAATFIRVIGRAADVHVDIVARAPIYVVGAVRNPGAHKLLPDMIVLQAVALAGGNGSGAEMTHEAMERVRLAERKAMTIEQLKRLYARQARFVALQSGAAQLTPSPELVALVGQDGAQAGLTVEQSLFEIERGRRSRESAADRTALAIATKEVDVTKRKMAELAQQQTARNEQLSNVVRLNREGYASRHGMLGMKSELSQLEQRRQDLLLAYAAAESRHEQLLRTHVQRTSDVAASTIEALQKLDTEITDLTLSLKTIEQLTSLLPTGSSSGGAFPARPDYEIVRSTLEGIQVVRATEGTRLQPGDVLKVSKTAASAGAARTGTVTGAIPLR